MSQVSNITVLFPLVFSLWQRLYDPPNAFWVDEKGAQELGEARGETESDSMRIRGVYSVVRPTCWSKRMEDYSDVNSLTHTHCQSWIREAIRERVISHALLFPV